MKSRLAFVIVVATALSMASCSDSQEGISSTIALTGADGDAEAIEAFAAVEAAYVMFNTGDEAWMEVRDRGSSARSTDDEYVPDDGTLGYFNGTQAADAHIEISGCESHGSGEWPDVTDDGTVSGYYFTCATVESNAFHAATGVEFAETYSWVVADGEVAAVGSEGDFDEWFDYSELFNAWVLITHPEISSEIEYVWWGSTRAFPTEGSIPTVLEYLDEFAAAQS